MGDSFEKRRNDAPHGDATSLAGWKKLDRKRSIGAVKRSSARNDAKRMGGSRGQKNATAVERPEAAGGAPARTGDA
jgi:hypothetical protein